MGIGFLAGLIAAAMLHGIYLILQSRRNEITKGVQYVEIGRAVEYQSVSEFLSIRKTRLVSFILFRTVPVLVVLVPTMAFLDKHSAHVSSKLTAVVAFMLANLCLTFFPRRKLLPFASIRILFWLLTLLNLVLAVVALTLSLIWDLSIFAIDIEALVGNLAAALIAAILVVFYLKSTDMGPKQVLTQDQQARELNEFVAQRGELIGYKYGHLIHEAADRSGLSPHLLLAILIYEDLNRPAPLRRIENLLVRIPGVALTVGVAQVQSTKPLTDAESIKRMGEVLAVSAEEHKTTNPYDQNRKLLSDYNGDPEYADNVLKIYWPSLAVRF